MKESIEEHMQAQGEVQPVLTDQHSPVKGSAEHLSSQVQSYEVTEEGVILRSRYYVGGEIELPFHNIHRGGQFYKNLRDAGFPKGGVQ